MSVGRRFDCLSNKGYIWIRRFLFVVSFTEISLEIIWSGFINYTYLLLIVFDECKELFLNIVRCEGIVSRHIKWVLFEGLIQSTGSLEKNFFWWFFEYFMWHKNEKKFSLSIEKRRKYCLLKIWLFTVEML